MNTNTQIQIHFPLPGEWGEFLLTALWKDAEGYACRRQYDAQELKAEQAEALAGVIRTLVSLGEPWACTHAAAELQEIVPEGEPTKGDTEPEPVPTQEAIRLTVHARRDADGATRIFTPADYPQLLLTDAALLSVFRGLTGASA